MACGPGLYVPDALKKSSAIDSYLRTYKVLLPEDTVISAPVIWHDDLHEENIFVDREDPTRILGIIDWQSSDILPLFDHNLDPPFVQFSGPEPESLDPPEMEATSDMSNEERARATEEYFEKALFIASRKISRKKTPTMYRAIQYQQTDAFNLLTIGRRIFEFGEAHFQALTTDLQPAWPELPLNARTTPSEPFPIEFSKERLAEVSNDFEKALRGLQIMNDFKARLGVLWPDKDAVSHERYDETKAAMRELKAELIARFAQSDADRREFDRLWPFDD
jgi:Phosphotransferase enzyme family